MSENSFAKKAATSGENPQSNQQTAGLLSRAEVAHRLGVCTHTIQRLTRRGELPAIVFNRRLIRYAVDAVDAYINSAITGRKERIQ